MKRKILLIAGLAGTLAAAFAATAAGAACERHVYNRSSRPWTFEADPARGHQGSLGNVWFDMRGCNARNGPCTIPAKTSVPIKYTAASGRTSGTMIVTDHRGKSRRFAYGALHRCPYIDHEGDTGSVAVNDPARGDWNAWADQW